MTGAAGSLGFEHTEGILRSELLWGELTLTQRPAPALLLQAVDFRLIRSPLVPVQPGRSLEPIRTSRWRLIMLGIAWPCQRRTDAGRLSVGAIGLHGVSSAAVVQAR